MTDSAASDAEEPTVDELADNELTRLRQVARMLVLGEADDLQGAMLLVRTPTGVQSYPYTPAGQDPRMNSLHLLAAHLAHVAHSASQASGEDVGPAVVASHAIDLLREIQEQQGGAD